MTPPLSPNEHDRLLSLKYLKAVLDYNSMTGFFTWQHRKGNSRGTKIFNTKWGGKIAGRSDNKYGYSRITICLHGKHEYYAAHRLAWYYVNGRWPPAGYDIDHINRDPWDNRISNLRLVTRSNNNINSTKLPKHNRSGVKGVHWDSTRDLWKVEIQARGVIYNLGRFATFEEACKARKRKEIELFGHFSPLYEKHN